jgi:hypothetical protein
MAGTNNAVNITASGIVKYDGAGTFSADTVTQHAMLVGGASNAITSQLLTNGQLMIGNTGNDPSAAVITPGAGISITNAAGSITVAVAGGGVSWSDTSGTFNAASNNGYFLTAASTPTLPVSPSEGDICEFIVVAAATMTITGNTGQLIRLGNTASAAAGTCASGVIGNTIRLVYRSTATTWWADSSVGSWTLT